MSSSGRGSSGGDPEARRRARFVFAIGVSTPPVTLAFAGIVLRNGRPWVALAFAMLGVATLACHLWMKRGGRPVAVGNVLAAVFAVAIGGMLVVRGTIGVPSAMAMSAVPAIATFVAGWRSGFRWMLVSLAIFGAIAAAPLLGVPVHDRAGVAEAHMLALASPPIFVVFMSLVSFAYDATRVEVLVLKRESDQARADALAEVQLAHANRLAAVGQLAASMAHEINNPLAYVKANLGFVEERLTELGIGTKADDIRTALAEAREGAMRVERIVRDLRTFSRIDEGAPLAGDVVTAMRAALKMATNEIQHRGRLEVDLAPAGAVRIDEGRLVQVFLNLLVNAAQSLSGPPGEQTIRVRVGRESREPQGRVFAEVEDSGGGISRENLARVFEPFFTTKPVGVGTGLGLTVCKNLVERAGGRLTIESEVGRGTRVRVVLPGAEPMVATGERARPSRPTPEAVRTILVVDDDSSVRRAVRRTLRRHAVVDVASVREALELVRGERSFDLVLCDLMMPESDGAELLERLRAEGSPLAERVVFLTGGELTDRARAVVEQNPARVVYKPFDPDALRELVKTATAVPLPRASTAAAG